jgi:hypothetical protein
VWPVIWCFIQFEVTQCGRKTRRVPQAIRAVMTWLKPAQPPHRVYGGCNREVSKALGFWNAF